MLHTIKTFIPRTETGTSLCGILYSYSKALSPMHEISSFQGKYKALFTCASPLSVGSLLYCMSLGCTLTLLLPMAHIQVPQPWWCTLWSHSWWILLSRDCRDKDITGALKRSFGWQVKKKQISWVDAVPLTVYLKHSEPEIAIIWSLLNKISPSIYFLGFSFFN